MIIDRKIRILLCIFLCSIAIESQAIIEILNDGQYHVIDYEAGGFWIDYRDGEKLGTTLEVIQNGKCGTAVGNRGKVIINGGELTGIAACGSSVVTFLSGTLDDDYSGKDGSHLEMSGGSITGSSDSIGIRLKNYSTARVSGGSLNGDLMLWGLSGLTFVGSDFAIDGISVGLYEDIKNYATYEHINDGIYGYTGVITGTLADGSELNNYFEIWDDDGESLANMYLIPEPCTVLLVGVGGMVVMGRRRRVGFEI